MRNSQEFKNNIHKALNNAELQLNQQKFLNKANFNRESAIKQFANLNLAKQRAAYAKWKVTENLDKYLVDFEANIIRKGGKVVWAYDAKTAINEIELIINRNKAEKLFKTHSSISDEIGLSDYFKEKKNNITESAFGDYINTSVNQKSSHPVFHSFLTQKAEVNKILNEKIKVSLDADNIELANDLREELRNKIYKADIAISGAQFLIAENGMVAICENEGNARMALSLAKTNIFIVGIDKIIPSLSDIELFLPLYASFSIGEKLNVYNTLTGPKNIDDNDGPDEFIVVLVDNGRSEILSTQNQREILSCINCGACYNVCPVFKNIGSSSYQANYTGPVGTIKVPLMDENQQYEHLNYASTNCGKCNQVCPVNIDIQNHIIRNRKDINLNTGDKIAWYTFKKFSLSRKAMNRASGLKNFTFKQLFKKDWGQNRILPEINDKSFNQLWREKNNLK